MPLESNADTAGTEAPWKFVSRSIRLNVWINLVHTFVIMAIQAVAAAGFFQPLFQLLDRLS